jgi:hypothetical protein
LSDIVSQRRAATAEGSCSAAGGIPLSPTRSKDKKKKSESDCVTGSHIPSHQGRRAL